VVTGWDPQRPGVDILWNFEGKNRMNLTDVLAKDAPRRYRVQRDLSEPKQGPQWVPVDSSRIKALIYSAPDRLLLVKFHGSANDPDPTYVYEDVSQALYDGLRRADKQDKSVGEYFERHVAGHKYVRFYEQEE
jgi:KTSC domain